MVKKLDYLPVVAKLIRRNIGFKARNIIRTKWLWNRGTGVLDWGCAGGVLGDGLTQLGHGYGESGGRRCEGYSQSSGRAEGEHAG